MTASGFDFHPGSRPGMLPAEKLSRMSREDAATGCKLWLGGKDSDGYGVVKVDKRSRAAHRVAWEQDHGPIPDGLVIDHRCRTRACINPAHMRVVTSRENTLCGSGPTAALAAKQTCKRGHAFDLVKSDGHRRCRTCARLTDQARRAWKRAGGSTP